MLYDPQTNPMLVILHFSQQIFCVILVTATWRPCELLIVYYTSSKDLYGWGKNIKHSRNSDHLTVKYSNANNNNLKKEDLFVRAEKPFALWYGNMHIHFDALRQPSSGTHIAAHQITC